jgi:hypothetical protein
VTVQVSQSVKRSVGSLAAVRQSSHVFYTRAKTNKLKGTSVLLCTVHCHRTQRQARALTSKNV